MNREEWSKRPGRSSKWISKRKRFLIYTRDRFCCVYCGYSLKLTLDHIKPRNCGGSHDASNLVTCCSKCNNTRQGTPLKLWCCYLSAKNCFNPHFREIMNRVKAARRRKL